MRYQLLMTEDELRLFSRHTPEDLEEYLHNKLTDKELKKMTDGEIDELIDSEARKATRNTNKYVGKKLKKYLLTGGLGGAVLGGAVGGAGGALLGGLGGTVIGVSGAQLRGSMKAAEEGHGRRHISGKTAIRADKARGGNSYARMREREDRLIQQQLDRERNAALWHNAHANYRRSW